VTNRSNKTRKTHVHVVNTVYKYILDTLKFRIEQSINNDISFTNTFRIVHFTNTQWHSVHKDIPDDQWIQKEIQLTNTCTFRIGQAIHKDIPHWLSNTQCYSVHKDIPYDQCIKRTFKTATDSSFPMVYLPF
jgi:hypothetical protein